MMKKLLHSVILILFLIIPMAFALPPISSEYYGELRINEELALDGTFVEARINGIQYASFITVSGYYDLIIPGDNPETPEIEGAVAGDVIEVFAEGSNLYSTLIWSSGSNERVDIGSFKTSLIEELPDDDVKEIKKYVKKTEEPVKKETKEIQKKKEQEKKIIIMEKPETIKRFEKEEVKKEINVNPVKNIEQKELKSKNYDSGVKKGKSFK